MEEVRGPIPVEMFMAAHGGALAEYGDLIDKARDLIHDVCIPNTSKWRVGLNVAHLSDLFVFVTLNGKALESTVLSTVCIVASNSQGRVVLAVTWKERLSEGSDVTRYKLYTGSIGYEGYVELLKRWQKQMTTLVKFEMQQDRFQVHHLDWVSIHSRAEAALAARNVSTETLKARRRNLLRKHRLNRAGIWQRQQAVLKKLGLDSDAIENKRSKIALTDDEMLVQMRDAFPELFAEPLPRAEDA